MRTLARASTLTLLIAALAGCMPKSITLNFTNERGRVRESVVMRDAGTAPKVAQIDLSGVITSGAGTAFGTPALLDDMALMLAKAEGDAQVRAVVLHINSPGGSVAASETLASLIEGFRKRSGKPVVVSMGEVAASGGYYAAVVADRIVAQPSTITGSVGVIVPTLNVSDGLARIGIRSRSITSGPNKDIANPLEPASEAHYAILQGIVDEFYSDFRARVIAARPDLRNPDSVLDGSVYTGRRALELGLVDKLGGIPEAFAEAKRLAGTENAVLVKYYRSGSKPLTPYASAESPESAIPRTENAGLIPGLAGRVTSSSDATDPGFYYLWLPPGSLTLE